MNSEMQNNEPDDHHIYDWVMFYKDTFHFFSQSVKFYVSMLESDIQAIENDKDLKGMISEDQKKSFQIYREHSRAKRVSEWLDTKIKEASPDAFDFDISISHGTVRFIKTACMLYLKNLKLKRNKLSVKKNISRYVLDTVDNQISKYEENINMGIFKSASLMPFLVDELVQEDSNNSVKECSDDLASVVRPRPVVIDTIQIIDPDLRARCLDLFDAFNNDGKHERFDTVISEATRIFETKLRSLSNAPQECVGVELAQAAFGGNPPVLKVSNVSAEQQAVNLLYRGAFGFIRNQVQHKLLGKLNPDRVLQILGFIDYLLYVAETAERTTGKRGKK